MKEFLKKNFQTDNIEKITFNDLKKGLEGEPLVSRFKYRERMSNFLNSKREIVGNEMNNKKGQEIVQDSIDNVGFGFKCLSYSVNESSG